MDESNSQPRTEATFAQTETGATRVGNAAVVALRDRAEVEITLRR